MGLPRNLHGRFVLTVFDRNVAVNIEDRKQIGLTVPLNALVRANRLIK
jgi:hypothetical protein